MAGNKIKIPILCQAAADHRKRQKGKSVSRETVCQMERNKEEEREEEIVAQSVRTLDSTLSPLITVFSSAAC